jgi:hypothetical protein
MLVVYKLVEGDCGTNVLIQKLNQVDQATSMNRAEAQVNYLQELLQCSRVP